MSSCQNMIESWIPYRYDYRKIETKCGNTGARGELVLCPDHEHEREEREDRTNYCRSLGFDM